MSSRIPAVGYIRMSSDKQEASPAQQRQAIEQTAGTKYQVIRWYQDDGISGAESEKREAFQRLVLEANSRNDFQAVLCWDQDRFSRFDPMEANYYWHILSKAGVKIVTTTQGELDFADLAGWLAASVTQYGKAQYLRDLSHNVLRGRLSRAKEGRWTGNRAPYGYSLSDGILTLGDPEKVDAVKWIFDQYANTDTSLQDLAEQLNQKEVPSPAGKPWQRAKGEQHPIEDVGRRTARTDVMGGLRRRLHRRHRRPPTSAPGHVGRMSGRRERIGSHRHGEQVAEQHGEHRCEVLRDAIAELTEVERIGVYLSLPWRVGRRPGTLGSGTSPPGWHVKPLRQLCRTDRETSCRTRP